MAFGPGQRTCGDDEVFAVGTNEKNGEPGTWGYIHRRPGKQNGNPGQDRLTPSRRRTLGCVIQSWGLACKIAVANEPVTSVKSVRKTPKWKSWVITHPVGGTNGPHPKVVVVITSCGASLQLHSFDCGRSRIRHHRLQRRHFNRQDN